MPHTSNAQRGGHVVNATISLVLALLALAAGAGAAAATYNNFLEALSSRPDLAVAEWLLHRANLTGLVSDPSFNGTALLPTNEAVDNFVRSQGFANIGDLLNQRPALSRLMWYHLCEDAVNVTDLLTRPGSAVWRTAYVGTGFASVSGLPTRILSVRGMRGNISSVRITTIEGVLAGASIVDVVPFAAANSSILIIDSLLPYWHSTLAEVLSANTSSNAPARQFVSGLSSAGLWGQMADAAASYTLFVPTQMAFDTAYSYFGSDVLDANLRDIVPYHVVSGSIVLKFRTQYNMSLISVRSTPSYNTLTVTGSETGAGVLADLAVQGLDTRGSVLKAFFVGGFNTASCVYLIDRVLFPVYSSVSGYLSAPGSGYAQLASMFRASSYQPDIRPRDQATFLAPNDQALTKYAHDTGLLGSINSTARVLALFLRNHVLRPPIPGTAALRDGMQLTTEASENVSVSVAGDGQVTLTANKSSARLLRPDAVPILYATSFVLPIDYVLVPSSMNLTAVPNGGGGSGGGSAAAAAPSFALVAATAVLACLAARVQLW